MNINSLGRNNFIHLPSCHSTNDFAMDLVKRGEATDGMVVITDNQTRGRGQQGNVWEAEAGQNLTFSLIVKTDSIKISDQFRINMAVSVGIREALACFVDSVTIKWPNDILVDHRKICGILIESTVRGQNLGYSIVGIGLNVNQMHFQHPYAVSLFTLTGKQFDLIDVLNKVLTEIQLFIELIKNHPSSFEISDLYLQNLYKRGVMTTFETNSVVSGVIMGVDTLGRLIVDCDGVLNYFNNKEIKFLL
ncbi:MAG: biotin--[acetyl-CoA-carboxylase] ligase [Cytophagales bacterium]|nr:biotin--[acetyl-CoA-carboxylase] ligase [Cytophagales bacterium]